MSASQCEPVLRGGCRGRRTGGRTGEWDGGDIIITPSLAAWGLAGVIITCIRLYFEANLFKAVSQLSLLCRRLTVIQA